MFCWWYSRIDAPSVASWGDRAVRGLAQAVGLVVTMGVNVNVLIALKRNARKTADDPSGSPRGEHNYPSSNAALTRTQAAACRKSCSRKAPPALCIAGLASRSLPPLGTPVLPKQLRYYVGG